MSKLFRRLGVGLLSLLAVWMLALPAVAQDEDWDDEEEEEEIDYQRTAFYINGSVAFADTHFDDQPNFGTGWGFNVRAGYRSIEHYAIEAQYEFFSHLLTRDDSPRAETSVQAITVNSKVPFFSGPLQPFIHYGMGAVIADNDLESGTLTDFAMRFGGGLDMYLTDHISFLTTIDYVRGFGDVRDYRWMSISTGINYRF